MPTRKTIIRRFDSVSEAVEASKKARNPKCASSSSEYERGWYKTESFEEACDLAVNGWDGIRADLSKIVKEVNGQIQESVGHTWEPTWDVAGAVVDIEAFNNGEPDCMITFDQIDAPQVKPVVTVLVNTCVSGGYSAREMLTRGAGICGLTECLMALGYSVEVWAECADGPCGGQYWDCLVKVKGADEFMDMDRLSFAIGHPSWLRRIMFGLMEGEKEEVRRRFGFGPEGYGYGRVGKCQMKKEVGADVVVEGALYGRDSASTAIEWIKGTLRQLGVEVRGEE